MDQFALVEKVVVIVVIVVCYAVAIVIVKRSKGRKGAALIESLTRVLLWLVAFGK